MLVITSIIIVSAKPPQYGSYLKLPPITQPNAPEEGFIIYCDEADGKLKTLDGYGETTILAVPQPPFLGFYDDFEDGTLDKWNIVSGDWEVIVEGENHVAHCIIGSVEDRRVVSKEPMVENIIINALLKGDSQDPEEIGADVSIGFYSNSDASSYYIISFRNNGDNLATIKEENVNSVLLAVNYSVKMINNIWFNLKIQLDGTSIYAKRWAVGEDEPVDWQISYVGATPYGNYIIMDTDSGINNVEFWFDNIQVTTLT